MKFILTQKKEMGQIFNEVSGRMTSVTVLVVSPSYVSQVKTIKKDGYSAVQIASQTKKSLLKPQIGHFKNLAVNAKSREFRLPEAEALKYSVGDKFTVSSFSVGDVVDATGVSKGRGFQGVVKRHGFKGSPASHGHKDQLRMPGSIGATDPGRVFKGTKMGGHMGDKQITTKGLTIEKVDREKNLLYVRGSVPGAIRGLIILRGTGEMKVEKSAPDSSAKNLEAGKNETVKKKETKKEEQKKTDETEDKKVSKKKTRVEVTA